MSNRNVSRVRSRNVVRNVRRTQPVRVTAVRTRDTNRNVVDTRVIDAIVRVVAKRGWAGSMTELSAALVRTSRSLSSVLPQNPRGLRSVVDRVLPRLRRLGIKARFGRTTDHSRKRFVEFVR